MSHLRDGARESADNEARAIYPSSAHFRAAYMRGVRAAKERKTQSSNPYKDSRHGLGAAFRNAWDRGWRDREALRVVDT